MLIMQWPVYVCNLYNNRIYLLLNEHTSYAVWQLLLYIVHVIIIEYNNNILSITKSRFKINEFVNNSIIVYPKNVQYLVINRYRYMMYNRYYMLLIQGETKKVVIIAYDNNNNNKYHSFAVVCTFAIHNNHKVVYTSRTPL